jgi:hypothetical protein
MTSAAFSMPGDHRRRVSIRRRATATATATSAAADAALDYMLDRRLRRREGRSPPPRRQVAGGGGSVASPGEFGSRLWLVRAGFLVFLALVLGAAVLTVVPAGASSHTVAGRVLCGKQPLRHATIVFHRANGGDDEPVSLTTGADGSFRIEEDRPLPAGLYAVVVAAAPAARVPPPYSAADTTPLRVLVTENLSGLQLLVRR